MIMDIASKRIITTICRQRNYPLEPINRKLSQRSWNIVRFDQDLKRAIQFNSSSQVPILNRPNEVMVKVLASSVNPLDIEMSRGYGNVMLSLGNTVMSHGIDRLTYGRLPVTPGRDFVGEIISKGQSIWNYKPGDIVWGTVPPYENGSHADYVITSDNAISYKPKNLSNVEAAALPYVGLTAWSSLSTFGELNAHNSNNKNVLVLGGSGGVGCFAIQLLKFWGSNVITTCSAKTIEPLKELTSADECIDYTRMEEFLRDYRGTFDLILDASSASASRKNYDIIKSVVNENQQNSNTIPSRSGPMTPVFDRKRTIYVTLSSPLLRNYDRYGLLSGTMSTISDALIDTLNGIQHGISFRWAYYLPNPKALAYIAQLVERGMIKPFTSNVYDFDKAIDAYEALEIKRPMMGKVVLNNDK
ncbi:NAD(P)H oxidoreductase RTN4IP1, mitochondrial [Dermatophagoides farinae]|uniref:NAD(P)H oxidoreductase RTN4IP1, mitochondrial n=1 Tax=Dermatophagoides farinae TaxID=6954 RepID=UPI003F5F8653